MFDNRSLGGTDVANQRLPRGWLSSRPRHLCFRICPRISAQYVAYNRFDGITTAASDNNTFYLQAWLVF